MQALVPKATVGLAKSREEKEQVVDRETEARPSSCRGLSPFRRGNDPLQLSNSTSSSRRRRATSHTGTTSSPPSPNQATRLMQLSRNPLLLLHAPILLRVLSQPQAVPSLEADRSSMRRSGAMDPGVDEGQGRASPRRPELVSAEWRGPKRGGARITSVRRLPPLRRLESRRLPQLRRAILLLDSAKPPSSSLTPLRVRVAGHHRQPVARRWPRYELHSYHGLMVVGLAEQPSSARRGGAGRPAAALERGGEEERRRGEGRGCGTRGLGERRGEMGRDFFFFGKEKGVEG